MTIAFTESSGNNILITENINSNSKHHSPYFTRKKRLCLKIKIRIRPILKKIIALTIE